MAANKKHSGETVLQLVESVEKTSEFSVWRKTNSSAYLSSLFVMVKDITLLEGNDGNVNEWLLSYYDKDDDTFTTFSSLGGQRATKEQAFKKGKTLPELKTGSVKAEVWDSIRAAEEVRSKKYKGEGASSIIAILQPLSGEEIFAGTDKAKKVAGPIPVWNITYITTSYNIVNIKVDAGTGKLLSDTMSGVMDFMQKDK
ncbi:hypothetical protein HYU40_00200 [Candidatus Woesearchaeota archaeon]|nr:hypothetical protein [Candidatus Woesearchaeota archaeon]